MKNISFIFLLGWLLSAWQVQALTITDEGGCQYKNATIGDVLMTTYYQDLDGDGYGNPDVSDQFAQKPPGYVGVPGDCDDTNSDINPAAPEICDNVDNNCNGILREGPCPDSELGEFSDECSPNVLTSEGFFNYGGLTGGINPSFVSNGTVGQPLVQAMFSTETVLGTGFWSRYNMTPTAPIVTATQGDLPDRVKISWKLDPISPVATKGYKLYRDGDLLASLNQEDDTYMDFNAEAGIFYTYEVAGINEIGEGPKGESLGFLSPNGVITGKVTTFNGNPVAGAVVTLTPTTGRAVEYDGTSSSYAEYSDVYPTNQFTVSAWVKIGDGNDKSSIVDFGSDIARNWWLHTNAAGSDKGVTFGIGRGGADVTELSYEFPVDEEDEWHYVTATFSGSALLLYVDSELVETAVNTMTADSSRVYFAQSPDGGNHFTGLLDEVRYFDYQMPQTEIEMFMNRSVGAGTQGLTAYWKFDEGIGAKAYNSSKNQIVVHHCGAIWTSDKPPVVNAGVTDEEGFYTIESINYGTGTTFTATPSKKFYFNQALEFNALNMSYAELADIDVTDTAAITTTFKAFDFSGKQVILSKTNPAGSPIFQVCLNAGNLEIIANGQTEDFGAVEMGYHYLAMNLEQIGSTLSLELFNDGVSIGTASFTGMANDWSGTPWTIGARQDGAGGQTDYFTGLIDEVIFYNDILSLPNIQTNTNIGTDVANISISSIFGLNEGQGTELEDLGPAMTGFGSLHNATWSTVTMINETLAHEFTPNNRLVTLNASNTSTDQVNFVDQSTVPISGVIRFENTFCFQDSVEILVNGHSLTPPKFTDEDGRFLVELEPGAKVKLTPKYGNDSTAHNFLPAFFEVRSLNVPIANVLFQNTTTRKVNGQIFGGLCRKSVINTYPDGTIDSVEVKLAALNGCYEEVIKINNLAGKYTFKDIPPIPVAVSIIKHKTPAIYDYFQLQGGQEVDLRNVKQDTVDFMYISAPVVEIGEVNDIVEYVCIDPLNPDAGSNNTGVLGIPLIKDSKHNDFGKNTKLYYNDIKVYQNYIGGKCYLDSFGLSVTNGIYELPVADTVVKDTNVFRHEYYANNANILYPHTKNIQVVANVNGAQSSASYKAIVLGERQKDATISTSGPSDIFGVLYDPPGDGSYATLAKGSTYCTNWHSANLFSESLDNSLAIKLGNKFEVAVGAPAAQKIESFSADNTTTVDVSLGFSQNLERGGEYCITTNKEISTSDGDDIWGDYADVYWGAAQNFKIGARDVLEWDADSCKFKDHDILTISPDSIATTFVYSHWQIQTEVIPQLKEIVVQGISPGITAEQYYRAVEDIKVWEKTLEDAAARKEAALKKADKNITFDAAVVYAESRETSDLSENTRTFTFNQGLAVTNEHGWDHNGWGLDWTISVAVDHEYTNANGSSYETTKETFFELADDDLNDFYSVAIGKDSIYGTPVFGIIGGESMCPWIPGTRNREEVFVQVDEPVAINIPSNTPAVFRATLGSIGPNGVDGLIYELGVDEGGNPDGAIIKVDGAPLIHPIEFQFIGNATVIKTITVEYPNTGQFDFEDLGLYFASVCQIEHSESVGYDAGDGGFLIYDEYSDANGGENYYSRFYKPVELDVHFIEPCSPIDIFFPLQNHVVTPGNEVLTVTLDEYVWNDPDLELARMQYRPLNGDGSWINIIELPVAEFVGYPVSKDVLWDMNDLKDGDYELRAITQCFDITLAPGISEVLLIKKETEAPELFGAPQPADGILSIGDEISITFNEQINCNKVFDADGIGSNINLNNIALVNTETGALVPFSSQCVGDKIIIEPKVQSKFINGKVLRAVATNIEDLAGNKMEVPLGAPGSPTVNYKEWEFLADLNPLRWEAGSNISESVAVGKGLTLTRNIVNQSGGIMDFSINGPRIVNADGAVTYEDIPSWMNVFPLSGTLEPGEIREITFVFPETLPQDDYFDEINLVGSEGYKSIDVDLRVMCPAPEWEFNPAAFTYSMNFSLELNIQGDGSEDKMDIVAAFIDGELRGKAYVEYVDALDRYEAFLTVYSDEFIDGTVEFRIWDADQCALYGDIIESFPFVADELVGDPNDPQVIHTSGLLMREIPLHAGWNWVSFNLGLPDPSLDSTLVSLNHPDNDLMKSQTAFANYYPSASAWIGSLSDLNNTEMFQYRADIPDTIDMVGTPIDYENIDIPIASGWNWIGYLPQDPMTVDEALGSLNPLNGDVIKSQTAFAQYVAGFGWLGNLDFMQSPKGYLLRMENAGTLTYPENFKPVDLEEKTLTGGTYETPWAVDLASFEHSMILIGMIQKDGENVTQEGQSIGVFANGETRGVAQSMYIEQIDQWLFFLTMYANHSGEPMEFKLYDAFTEESTDLDEQLFFAIDGQSGSLDYPTPFNMGDVLNSTEEELAEKGLFVKPNPFSDNVQVRFYTPNTGEAIITLTDAMGRMVMTDELDTVNGWNGLDWNTAHLTPGIYTIQVQTNGMTMTRKVVAK